MKYTLIILTIFILYIPIQAQDIKKEPIFKYYIISTTTDLVASSFLIDGKRISEGNPLARNKDGSVNVTKAMFLKAAMLIGTYVIYKKNNDLGRLMMKVGTYSQFAATGIVIVYSF